MRIRERNSRHKRIGNLMAKKNKAGYLFIAPFFRNAFHFHPGIGGFFLNILLNLLPSNSIMCSRNLSVSATTLQ